MNVWVALIGGVILGWLIEWIIDWYYWRRGAEAFYTMEHDLRQELQMTRQQLAEAQAALERLGEQSGPETISPVTGARVTGSGEHRSH